MDIQLLDGIDIQLLDGAQGQDDPRISLALGLVERQMRQDAARSRFITRASGGFTNEVGDDADTVAAGYDFAGFAGDGGVADDEMTRQYLLRTKSVVDSCPGMVAAYQDPAELSGMIGYVLDKWDTPEREEAIEQMADREERLIGAGLVNANIAGDYDDPTAEDYTVVDNYDYDTMAGLEDSALDEDTTSDGFEVEYVNGLNGTQKKKLKKISGALRAQKANAATVAKAKTRKSKGGLFAALKKMSGNSKLTTEAKDIVAANPATRKLKGRLRKAVGQMRRTRKRTVKAGDTVKTVKSTTATSVSGLGDIGETDPQVEALLTGRDMEYMVSGANPMEAYKTYLTRTRDVSASRPDLFDSPEEQTATVAACDAMLRAWGNKALLDAVLTRMEADGSVDGLGGDEDGPLNGRLRKRLKKLASKVKKAVKKVGTAVKKAVKAVGKGFKKLGKAIAKVAKKVWKFIVRFNPLTLLIRAGILAVCRLNMFKIANKTYPGSLDKATALKKGISEEEWKKSNESYGHLKKAYTAIGGKESKLKKCLEKGCKKKWSGVEYPESKADIEAAKKTAQKTNDPETQQDVNEAKAEMAKQGAKEDKNAPTNVATETRKVQVEVIENERTAKNATPIRETGENGGKVLATVPKGAKVLVDTKQGDATWIAATWGTKSGWMLKSQLAGIGDDDAESMLVYGLGEIYDTYGETQGLGDPATGTSVAAAMSTITAILAKIKKIFGKAKEVVDKVKDVKDKVKSGVENIKAVKAATQAVKDVKNTVDTVKSGVRAVKDDIVDPAKQAVQAVKNVKNTVDTVKSGVQAVKSTTVGPAKQAVQAVKNVKNTVDTVKIGKQAVKDTTVGPANQVVQAAQNVASTARGAETTAASYATQAQQAAQQQTAQTKTSSAKKWIIGGMVAAALGGLVYLITRKKQ